MDTDFIDPVLQDILFQNSQGFWRDFLSYLSVCCTYTWSIATVSDCMAPFTFQGEDYALHLSTPLTAHNRRRVNLQMG